MSKSLAVKVSTAKLIKALEEALAKREKVEAEYKKEVEAYEKAYDAFLESLISQIGTKKLTLKGKSLRKDFRTEADVVEFEFTLDKSLKVPEAPKRKTPHWTYDSQCEEIRNAIAILKMTDDEYVSTNTYKGVAQYL